LRATAPGVTTFDASDGVPVPAAFLAVTKKVYDVPAVSPATVHVRVPVVVQVFAPGEEVTV